MLDWSIWNHLTVCKQMSSGLFINGIYILFDKKLYIFYMYMYQKDLALNNLQRLICSEPDQTTNQPTNLLITKLRETMSNKSNIRTSLRPTPKEYLMALSFSGWRPWIRVVSYINHWFEIRKFHETTSKTVIRMLSEIFATHRIPNSYLW